MIDPTPVAPPRRAVWELTWRCNLRCSHCLVEGGPNDKVELDPDEALDLVDQIADLGVERLTLTGGEPLMRRDWPALLRRAGDRGLVRILSSNGHGIHAAQARQMADLGVSMVVMSIDGDPATHDEARRYPEARARRSSHAEVVAAIGQLRAVGIGVAVITAVNKGNLAELPSVHAGLKALGIDSWMVQLSHATGRLDRGAMLDPDQMPALAAFLVAAAQDPVLPPMVHSSIGWLSADELTLRRSGRDEPRAIWRGPVCGKTVVGIEPDGGVKGCPNQVGAPFVVGSVRDEPLATIWRDRSRWHWVDMGPERAAGACAPCGLKGLCGGGCPCVSYASSGQTFDNPLCLRAVERGR